jgi:phosphatidylserine/phosphatidylglycerophosphate/cardiolipin synthase-like enzyme
VENKHLQALIEIYSHLPSSSIDRIILILRSEKERFNVIQSLQSDFGSSASIKALNQLIITSNLDLEAIALVFDSLSTYRKLMPESKISLVWSGPNLVGVPMRMTSQVMLEIIDQSKERLFLSSFSLYRIESIFYALEKAINRGVQIALLLETPQSSLYKIKQDPMEDFSSEFKKKANFYIWPYKNRKIEGDDQTGSLHAKFILQDDKRLFITSANLTQYAMDRNIELGVIIEDQLAIKKLCDHLDILISENVITKIS